MARKEFEAPENPPIELDQTFTPYMEIKSPDQLFAEYPFMFAINGYLVQGGLQINIGSSFASDNSPAIRPFFTDGDGMYRIDMRDTQLDLRHDKLSEATSEEFRDIIEGGDILGYADDLFSGRVNFPPKLSLCLFDNNLRGFTPDEQDLLRQVSLVVIFDETARMRAAVGSIFFPRDLTAGDKFPLIDAMMRQNALVHPIGKGTKGRIPFGRIVSFLPVDIQPLASNDPLTNLMRGKVGAGHPVEMPRDLADNLDLIRFTQFRFTLIT